MRAYEHIKALPPAGIGSLVSKKICTTALAFVTAIACATSASAQSVPNKADSISASATLSYAQSAKAQSADAKKKKKPAPKPAANPSAVAMPASPPTSYGAALQAQNPLTPLYSLLNENSTNFRMGPLERTQNVLLIEPVIPIRLTPDFNLITRWITPVIWQPRLAEPVGPFPGIGPEFGLGNIAPQFFFTPAHSGDGFVWGLGANAWLPTAKNKTLGVNEWGGGPTAVALWIQGPLLFGVLASQTWAGKHGTSLTSERIDQTAIQPFIFYNLNAGWYLASLPIITVDWTVPDHDHRWTLPIGGGIGRVIPVGNMLMNVRLDAYYNNTFGHAAGITNIGDWSAKFTLHFVLPNTKAPQLF